MHYEKKVLAEMNKVYSIGKFDGEEGPGFLVATEKEGPCLLFDLEGQLRERVWEGPGGVMTIAQVPGRKDQFLATQKFFSPNCGGDEAKIVLCTREGKNRWVVETLCELPYVHRFGILQAEDGRYHLIACTIKSACEYKEDWRFPGVTYVAELPVDDLRSHTGEHALELHVLLDQQLKNHGFYLAPQADFCLVCTQEAVMKICPPKRAGAEWTVETLLHKAVSDACFVDFEGTGKPELVTLSDFHGDELAVYRQEEGTWKQVYLHDQPLPFLHAIWSTKVAGQACAILGHRKGDRDLFRFFKQNGSYHLETIDHDFGPANTWVYSHEGHDYIVATNRETDQLALYKAVEA